MTNENLALLESLIDAKLERAVLAARVGIMEMSGPEIMNMMIPIEAKLEEIRQKFRKG